MDKILILILVGMFSAFTALLVWLIVDNNKQQKALFKRIRARKRTIKV